MPDIVLDVVFVAAGTLFLVLCSGYAVLCDRL
jgi:hypothetical protein